MKKIFRKVLSVVTSIIMSVTMIGVYPDNNASAFSKEDKYQLELASYLSSDSVALSYLNQDINMPYRKYVEDRITNPAWISLISGWKVATFDLSDVTEMSLKQVGYYETILFDILKTERESESELENLDKIFKSTHASAVKNVYDLYGNCLSTELSELKKDSDKYNQILDTVEDMEEFKNVFKQLGTIEKIIGYGKDLNDILYKCSVLETIAGSNECLSEIFTDIAEYTIDPALEMACNNFAEICSGSLTDEEIQAIFISEWGVKEVSNEIVSNIWEKIVEECTGYGLAIKAGQDMGKLGANLLFSTEEDIEHFFSCCALYEFEDQLCTAATIYKNTY